jgi:hypothetical protein
VSIDCREVVRELLSAEGKFSGDVFLLPSQIPLQLVRIFQKNLRFQHCPPSRFRHGNPSGSNWGGAYD